MIPETTEIPAFAGMTPRRWQGRHVPESLVGRCDTELRRALGQLFTAHSQNKIAQPTHLAAITAFDVTKAEAGMQNMIPAAASGSPRGAR
jgi:hypothetical protein